MALPSGLPRERHNQTRIIGHPRPAPPDVQCRRKYAPNHQVTVLLGEPDPTLAAHVTALWSDGLVRVHNCADAGELMFLAGRLRPDVIVTRALFGNESVVDLIETIRAHDNVPIILSMSLEETDTAAPALSAGATELIDHPYRDDVLRLLRQRHLEPMKARMLQAARVQVGGLVVDGPAYAAWVNGRELALAPREFEVLQLLVNRADRVVSFEELRTLVWHARGEDVTRQTVNVHIYRIRGHIAEAAEITTVRGVGYRLAATVVE